MALLNQVVRVLLLGAVLGACTGTPEPPRYRVTGMNISSLAIYGPERLAGDWQVVAGYADATLGAPETWVRFVTDGPEMYLESAEQRLPLRQLAPARFALPDQVLWVLWADADDRVAVVGSPDGRLGWVMARAGVSRPDLLRSGYEILGWNGYDMARLRMR